jgi:hypothetical protein
MEDNTSMETSPLTEELYSIDWAVRFDEFRQYNQSSFTDLHQLLAKIEGLVESEVANDAGDLNDVKVLTTRFNKAKSGSLEWHRLSILIHLKIILSAVPKGLTATATLSAIQIMEHMWKIVESANETKTANPKSSQAGATNNATIKKPVVKAVPSPAPRSKAKAAANKPAAKTAAKQTTKQTANTNTDKKVDDKTENVVIKKLAAEAGLDEDKALETRCYEVASSLAEEYPEYTLTAIRVMTAEKLGVTRQFIENLDIKPARFQNG